jgi:protein-S-isoprenylcysteine O-methyltransferase Ste14
MPQPRDASSPFAWPPAIYGSTVVVAGLLSWFIGWSFQPVSMRWIGIFAGVLIGGLGGAMALLAEMGFKEAGTAVLPTRPTTTIVRAGVYRFTRNPMYLGMTLGLIGLALALDQLWFLIAVPIAVVAVTKLAIEREEAYLAQKFGAVYLDYKAAVRRWF